MVDGQTKTFDSLFIFLLFKQTIKAKKHQRNKRTYNLYKSSYFWQLLESWTSCYFLLQFPYNPCNHPVILMNELFCWFSLKRQQQIF